MNPSNKAPNAKRVAAGRLNRAKRKSLTPDGAERVRQAALRNRPWVHSTGPKTAEGKKRSAANGLRRAKGGQSANAARREVAALRDFLAAMIGARRAAVPTNSPDPGSTPSR